MPRPSIGRAYCRRADISGPMALVTGRHGTLRLGLAAVLCLGLALSLPGIEPATAKPDGTFLVPTEERAGFGAFEDGPHAATRLRHAFGPPTEEKAGAYANCRMTWERLGIAVELDAPGGA